MPFTVEASDGEGEPASFSFSVSVPDVFAAADAGLTPLENSSSDFGDVDYDGDPDLLAAGQNEDAERMVTVYENDGAGNFSDLGAGLSVGAAGGAVSIGDANGDGNYDVAVTGERATSPSRGGTTLYEGLRANSVSASASTSVGGDGSVDFGDTGAAIDFTGTSGSGSVLVKKLDTRPSGTRGIPEDNVSTYRFVIGAGGGLTFDEAAVRFDTGTLGGVGDASNVAVDSARNASDSTTARLQIPDRTPLDPPAQVRSVNEDGVQAVVRWNASTALDVTTYRVYRRVGDGPDSLWAEVPQGVHHVPDDDVESGRQYRYAVSAVDSVGNEGPRSEPAEFTMRDFAAPTAVRNVQAQVQPDGGVRIRWETVSADDVTGYRVSRTPEIPTGIYDPIHEDLVSGDQYVDPEGEEGMWYQVRAIDRAENESRPSEPARAVSAPPR